MNDERSKRGRPVKTDEAFKALADPTRRRILALLRQGEQTAGQLAEHFGISKPSMSHHFNVLKAADLIGSRKEGQQVVYFLNTTVVQDLWVVLLEFLGTTDPSASPPPNGE
jgi:DNA-binding transcriptional ArsR family regulator